MFKFVQGMMGVRCPETSWLRRKLGGSGFESRLLFLVLKDTVSIFETV